MISSVLPETPENISGRTFPAKAGLFFHGSIVKKFGHFAFSTALNIVEEA